MMNFGPPQSLMQKYLQTSAVPGIPTSPTMGTGGIKPPMTPPPVFNGPHNGPPTPMPTTGGVRPDMNNPMANTGGPKIDVGAGINPMMNRGIQPMNSVQGPSLGQNPQGMSPDMMALFSKLMMNR